MKIGMVRAGKEQLGYNLKPVFSYKNEQIAEIFSVDDEIIKWDLKNFDYKNHYESIDTSEMEQLFKKAGEIFAEDKIQMGGDSISPMEYAKLCTLSSGAPISAPLNTLERVKSQFNDIGRLLKFQAPNSDINAYKNKYYKRENKVIGFIPNGKNLFVMTPSNHPSVNLLWAIAVAMGYPVIIRPSFTDPFTPLRLMNSMIKAGLYASSFSYYPANHSCVNSFVKLCDCAMLFGGENLIKEYNNKLNTKIYGPGKSAIIIDSDFADRIDAIIDLIIESMMKDGGRGCINASIIITKKNGKKIAERIAEKVSNIFPLEPTDKNAILGAFSNRHIAELISNQIDKGLTKKIIDITTIHRKTTRLVESFETTFLLPTVIYCGEYEKSEDSIVGREYSFPFLSVVEMKDNRQILDLVSKSLVVTLLSNDTDLLNKLIASPHIGKVFNGTFSTCDIDYMEAHEGFISEFLYKTKAIRMEKDNEKYNRRPVE